MRRFSLLASLAFCCSVLIVAALPAAAFQQTGRMSPIHGRSLADGPHVVSGTRTFYVPEDGHATPAQPTSLPADGLAFLDRSSPFTPDSPGAITAAPSAIRPAVVDLAATRSYFIDISGKEAPSPIGGQTLYAAVDMLMGGSPSNIVTLTARVFIDGDIFCGGTVTVPLINGATQIYCRVPFYPEPGTHIMQWDLNYDASTPETNFTNNTIVKVFSPVAAKVDLIARNAYFMTGANLTGNVVVTPVVGQAVYLYLDLIVEGTLTPVNGKMTATLDGTFYCNVSGNVVAGFYYAQCAAPWTVTPGWHTINWKVDPDGVVDENVESNNSASVRFGDTMPQSGWWWDPKLNGQGFYIEYGGNSNNGMFLGGFTYDSSGRATWLVSTGQMNKNLYSGKWLKVSGGPTLLGTPIGKIPDSQVEVGNISVLFTDSTHGTMTRSDGSVIQIQRLGFTAFTNIPPPWFGTPQSGWWWGPYPGTGYGLEIQDGAIFLVAYVYDNAGNPVWYLATGSMVTPTMYTGTWHSYSNGPPLNAVESPNWGATDGGVAANMTLVFSDYSHGMLTMGPNQIPISRFQIF